MIEVVKVTEINELINSNDSFNYASGIAILMDKKSFELFKHFLDKAFRNYPTLQVRNPKVGSMLDILSAKCEDVK